MDANTRDTVIRAILPTFLAALVFLYVLQVAFIVIFGAHWVSTLPMIWMVLAGVGSVTLFTALVRQEAREMRRRNELWRQSWRRMIEIDFPACDRVNSRQSLRAAFTDS